MKLLTSFQINMSVNPGILQSLQHFRNKSTLLMKGFKDNFASDNSLEKKVQLI